MASISTDKAGRRMVQFVGGDRKRRSIRLGTVPMKQAEEFAHKIDALCRSNKMGCAVSPGVAQWVSELPQVMADRLAKVGLIAPRIVAGSGPTLEAFLDGYIAGRSDLKPGTVVNLEATKKHLVDYFGATRLLADITAGDADEFRRNLLKTRAENTVRRSCSRARQFFRAAVRKKVIGENPFADMKHCGVKANREREFFVTRDDAAKVLDTCPDTEWKLIFALSRYGGLRCPSEHQALRWNDIDWARSRMTVRSPKTEGTGKASRIVPIFPELRPYLDAAYHAAPDRAEFVIARHRDSRANLRTHLTRIIEKAGLVPWPKLFQNCRQSRATELAAEYPGHVAAEWLGHTQLIAQEHYWRVTDDDFNRALQKSVQAGAELAETDGNAPSAEVQVIRPVPVGSGQFSSSVQNESYPARIRT